MASKLEFLIIGKGKERKVLLKKGLHEFRLTVEQAETLAALLKAAKIGK